ncbi:MAG: AAA family ATPase [Acidithiobacillus sp.]
MPLTSVTIKSFKSIVETTLDLGQLNVLIGTNGSGKSNILEAIATLSCAVDSRIDYAKLAERGSRLSAPKIFKSSFSGITRSNHFTLHGDFGKLSYTATVNAKADANFNFITELYMRGNTKLGGRSNAGIAIPELKGKITAQNGITASLEALGKFSVSDLKELSAIRNYAIYSLSTTILRGVSEDSSRKEPLGLYGGGLANALADVIRDSRKNKEAPGHDLQLFFKMFDWFKSIGTTSDISNELLSNHVHTTNTVVKFADKFMRDSFNEIYAYDVSEGALYILFLVVLLLHKNSPDFFALDNVDTALNPGLIRKTIKSVAELLKKMPAKQIIMTTHNPSTLDAIDLFDPTHRLFVVKRNAYGHTKAERIMPPDGYTRESWIKEHGGMRLSEIWLSGIIGGLTDF